MGSAFFDHQGACAGALSVTGLKVDVALREVQQLGVTCENTQTASVRCSGAAPEGGRLSREGLGRH